MLTKRKSHRLLLYVYNLGYWLKKLQGIICLVFFNGIKISLCWRDDTYINTISFQGCIKTTHWMPPTGLHNIDKTRPERHFKKSILPVKVGCGFAHWMIHLNNVYLFFNIPSHRTKRDKLSMQGRVRLVILGALMSITVVLNENVSTFC